MNKPLPKHTLKLGRLAAFSFALFLVGLFGCQRSTINAEVPTEFSIEHAHIIDSPNRYGGSVSDKTLKLIEQRIQDYGLNDQDVWFIYLRANSKHDLTRYYAEVYMPPEPIEGRMYGGEFVVMRTEAVDEELSVVMAKFEEPMPSQVHPYLWVKPADSSTPTSGLESVDLNTLPITPVDNFPHDRLIALIDLMRTSPQMPSTTTHSGHGDRKLEIVMPGEKVEPNRPVWKIEGSLKEPEVYLLDSDRRRKRGQFVTLVWLDDRYQVEGIGQYGASTGWLWQY
ncbi:hypothetical protein [Algisphaera agarilytica]|uniref:Lipoprotein n=1 Tax=Algisphaera agarilytica TaxID=1385975 RepID=A0A7X0LLC6_9BACT|nr:hypothetical protein [Algisphaera agarilytica]MBB6430877.1 hypothetical protein [Algisphaera agarilytica]